MILAAWLWSPALQAALQVGGNGVGSAAPAGPQRTRGLSLTTGCRLAPVLAFLPWRSPGVLTSPGYPRIPILVTPHFNGGSWPWALPTVPRGQDQCPSQLWVPHRAPSAVPNTREV